MVALRAYLRVVVKLICNSILVRTTKRILIFITLNNIYMLVYALKSLEALQRKFAPCFVNKFSFDLVKKNPPDCKDEGKANFRLSMLYKKKNIWTLENFGNETRLIVNYFEEISPDPTKPKSIKYLALLNNSTQEYTLPHITFDHLVNNVFYTYRNSAPLTSVVASDPYLRGITLTNEFILKGRVEELYKTKYEKEHPFVQHLMKIRLEAEDQLATSKNNN